ncbi:3-hydroxyacyl-CoA dehydrogenase family protein [Natribacillus halophilus]|uniref:L-gulonate 3-dehydrogenase n=1 Tax=Natribacillus halophilus TaxID=549003 RepID=A0A1G8MM12_9BACI|nr:3-hydroxyacyl-CoA dehydrogenase family protein [Natribacillus halophilus]SDI68370.1 3-hydroxybutyryl-CoA dehydrogenase [Natribacillus halophilus]
MVVSNEVEENVVVIGTGTMGSSIALNFASSNIQVKMYGINNEEIHKAVRLIKEKVMFLYQSELISKADVESIPKNIISTTSLSYALKNSSFIIEAVPENLELKQSLFHNIEMLCSRDAIIASNTSSLKPTEISKKLEFQDRIMVTHFWNPAHLIPLVEIVKGEHTSEEVVERSMKLMKQIGKQAIKVEREITGFVGNRLQYALFREAQYLLENKVASVEDIDTAVETSIGRRLGETGPFKTADMGGLDVFKSISEYIFPDLAIDRSPLPNLHNHVAKGNYGQKSGNGYYKWSQDFNDEMNAKREKELVRFLKKDR